MPETTENTNEKTIFYGPRGLAVKILNRIDRTDAYLDKLIDSELERADLSPQDKALLYELVHGVIRWMTRLDWVLTGFYKGQYAKSISDIKNALRVAVYQILFLEKIPDYAIVNDAVEYIKRFQGQKAANLTNAVLRNIIRSKNKISFPTPEDEPVYYISNYYSHPAWLIKRWIRRYGREFTEQLAIANNERPKLTIRVNNIKSNPEELKSELKREGLTFVEGKYLPGYFILEKFTNLTASEAFQKGLFTIQDESTGLPCYLLDVNAETRVLDLCAAPGGKTALLADLMNNAGEIVAIDKYESRLNVLRRNLSRLGVKNVKTIAVDALDYEDEAGFDRVLVDVPCSGLGTLQKKPDIKWKRALMDIKKLNPLQIDLLRKAARLVKPGGYVVYSTCTIEPDENFEIVQQFLDENLDFELVPADKTFPPELVGKETKCVETFPHIHGMDGSFSAKLRRKK
jgi:16S rRNA (cytosine967-C5)-methyltransferase